MSNVTFQDRAVAFVDVLGFTALTYSATNDSGELERLQALVATLDQAIPVLNDGVSNDVPSDLVPLHLYVSDCIILSAPLRHEDPDWSHYSGLEIVAMRTIQLTHHLLSEGYLVRGGITVGAMWHTAQNVVGPAYIEAYKLESDTVKPRIVFNDRARAEWRKGFCGDSRMAIDYDGEFMINWLHDHYIPGS